MSKLKNKNIVLGITGGISCYKTVEFARMLIKEGANVQVIMTQNATQFVTPLTFEAITQKPVLLHLFESTSVIHHIDNARFADGIIVMPATASFMARLAHGFADDLLSATCLATQAPIILVPAMNKQMWSNLATQNNIECLKSRQIHVMDTDFGEQACGDVGYGRMLEPLEVLNRVIARWTPESSTFIGKKVLITVGSTREPMDAVRYISNHSSGKMGFSLAAVFQHSGAEVTLICGHCEVSPPAGCELVQVQTAQEMSTEVLKRVGQYDIFIGAAAVADYRVKDALDRKMKSDRSEVHLELIKNPDIIAQVGALKDKPFVVGFALETEDLLENAAKKLRQKNLDMVVANLCDDSHHPFGSDQNEVFILTTQSDMPIGLKKADKREIAREIVCHIEKMIQSAYLHPTSFPCKVKSHNN